MTRFANAAASRTLTAYHEAGHAVVAHHQGYQPAMVTIVPRGRTLGRCKLAGGQNASHRHRRRHWFENDWAAIYSAGLAAEILYESRLSGRSSNDVVRDEIWLRAAIHRSGTDVLNALRLFEDDGREGARASVGAALAPTARLLRRHWRAVEVLAEALVADRRLTGRRTRAIISRALP